MSETNHLKDLEAKHAETIQNIEKLQELESSLRQWIRMLHLPFDPVATNLQNKRR